MTGTLERWDVSKTIRDTITIIDGKAYNDYDVETPSLLPILQNAGLSEARLHWTVRNIGESQKAVITRYPETSIAPHRSQELFIDEAKIKLPDGWYSLNDEQLRALTAELEGVLEGEFE